MVTLKGQKWLEGSWEVLVTFWFLVQVLAVWVGSVSELTELRIYDTCIFLM